MRRLGHSSSCRSLSGPCFDGVEFADVEAARREAIVACGELLREVPAVIWNGDSVRLWVTDQPDGQGNTLYSLNISPGVRQRSHLPPLHSRRRRRGTAAEQLNAPVESVS